MPTFVPVIAVDVPPTPWSPRLALFEIFVRLGAKLDSVLVDEAFKLVIGWTGG